MQSLGPSGFRVICPEDCGNAPKKAQLRDFTAAAVQGDLHRVLAHISDRIEWEITGSGKFAGKEQFAEAQRQMHGKPAAELEIRHILTHGKTGVVNGAVKYADGKKRSFCDVYVFTGSAKDAKIREIVSYVIDHPGQETGDPAPS